MSDFMGELMECVRVFDQVISAEQDRACIGDHDPLRAAAARAQIVGDRLRVIIAASEERKRRSGEDLRAFADSCCGSCAPGRCYVDGVLGN